LAPKKDDDITFRNAVVASYTDFGRTDGNHDFAANRFEMVPSQTSLAELHLLVPIATAVVPSEIDGEALWPTTVIS
jgi:hypothetical protein